MNHALPSRRLPADVWTDEHRALLPTLQAVGVDPADARPEWIETTTLVEDVDGNPAGIETTRSAAVTNCPPDHEPEVSFSYDDPREVDGPESEL